MNQTKPIHDPAKLTPASLSGVIVGSLLFVAGIIILILYLSGKLVPVGGNEGGPTSPPEFSCDRPLAGMENGLYMRKANDSQSRIYIPNTSYFLDAVSQAGFTIAFWFRIPQFLYPCNPTCPAKKVIPLWRRHDNINFIWDCNLEITPIITAPLGTNELAIVFSMPDGVATYKASPPPGTLYTLANWHYFAYAIALDQSRNITSFTAWIDGAQLTTVLTTTGAVPPLSAVTLTSLNFGAIGDNTAPVPLMDTNSLTYFVDVLSTEQINALMADGQATTATALTYSSNIGAWNLGKGDVQYTYGYSERPSFCVRASMANNVVIMITQ